jgi:hypothetical protein
MLSSTVTIRRTNPNGLRQLMARLEGLRMTVGVHATERDEGGGPMAVIAGVHEFGSMRIPARPFMRPTIWSRRESYTKRLRGALRRAIRGTGSLRVDMAKLGESVVRDMQGTIRAQGEPAGSFAPLSQETLERREARTGGRPRNSRFTGHKALIDTGRLINSIRWVLNVDGQTTGRAPRSGGTP